MTVSSGSSGAVFLSNVDDYLSPSQACVNPLYADTKSTESETPQQPTPNAVENAVIARPHRRGRRLIGVTRSTTDTVMSESQTSATLTSVHDDSKRTTTSQKVTASIADCLACSGCITTAETVLLQDHSLERLRKVLFPDRHEDSSSRGSDHVVLATVSPASMADLARMLQLEDLEHNSQQTDPTLPTSSSQYTQRKDSRSLQVMVVKLLIHLLRIDIVLDGNVALEWSLQHAAKEFIAWKRQQMEQATLRSMRMQKDNSSNASKTGEGPLIASSCPAVVCLVEKNHHDCVPRLSQTKSPLMAAAQAIEEATKGLCLDVRELDDYQAMKNGDTDYSSGSSGLRVLHLAIMPCHDKKLEASRIVQSDDKLVTTMAITTEECWQMLQEESMTHFQGTGIQPFLALAQNLCPPVVVKDWNSCWSTIMRQSRIRSDADVPRHSGYFVTHLVEDSSELMEADATETNDPMSVEESCEEPRASVQCQGKSMDTSMSENQTLLQPSTSLGPFIQTSGGYADYIFRAAARELFGIELQQVPWRPVATSIGSNGTAGGSAPISARLARSRLRQSRDYWEATLFKRTNGMNGRVDFVTSKDDTSSEILVFPVLRFVIAHGMQTMQRAISSDTNLVSGAVDYIEAMACPSGCLNGGGQVRAGAIGREAPRVTQERLQAARDCFVARDDSSSKESKKGYAGPMNMTTSFHKVAPMQLTMGAGKGVAVKDIQW